jgi:hypothetical protein
VPACRSRDVRNAFVVMCGRQQPIFHSDGILANHSQENSATPSVLQSQTSLHGYVTFAVSYLRATGAGVTFQGALGASFAVAALTGRPIDSLHIDQNLSFNAISPIRGSFALVTLPNVPAPRLVLGPFGLV